MSHVRYMDQSVPFWDFVKSLEEQGARPDGGSDSRKPAGTGRGRRGHGQGHGQGRGRGGFGRRGGFGGRMGGRRHGQVQVDSDITTSDSSDDETPIMTPATAISEKQPLLNEKNIETEQVTDNTTTDTETENEGPRKTRRGKMGRRGMGCRRGGFGGRGGRGMGMGRRGGFGPHGMMPHGPHGMGPFPMRPHGMPHHPHFGAHGPGAHGPGPHGFGPHGMRPPFGPFGMGPHSFGPRGRGGPFGGMRGGRRAGPGPHKRGENKKNAETVFDVSDLSDALNGYTSSSSSSSNDSTIKARKGNKKGLKNKKGANKKAGKNGVNKKLPKDVDFRPLADVFNTPNSFIVHVALPGAKREDVNLAWRPKRGVLVVSGNVARPADEALLQSLKRSERKVGAFRRRIQLGRRNKPAQIEAERIDATLEAGVLRITVPKNKKKEQEYVDVEKNDLL